MIRDPSDGSVKEKQKYETALPVSKEKKEELERLERAGKWLRDWREKRENVR